MENSVIVPLTPHGLALRVSVTDHCQLRCRYCMPAEVVPLCGRDEILSYEEIAALVACLQKGFGLSKVRITGGEPLVRPHIERLITMLADLGIPDLALTTNGLHLARMAPSLKRAGLSHVNVSVDSLSPAMFRYLTHGGDVRATLAGIATAWRHGLLPVKLNTVVIRSVNDSELSELVASAIRQHCEIRFIELMPIGRGRISTRTADRLSDQKRRYLRARNAAGGRHRGRHQGGTSGIEGKDREPDF